MCSAFNGRPGKSGKNLKGSQVDIESVCPFWILDKTDGKVKLNPRVNQKEWPFNAWRSVEKDGHVESVYCGVRRQDINAGKHLQEEIALTRERNRTSFADTQPFRSRSSSASSP